MRIAAYLDPSPHSDDPRRTLRRTLRLEALGATADGTRTPVTVHNISASGLLIETKAFLEFGAVIALELPEAGERHATVRWTSGVFYGCELEVPLTTAELSATQLRAIATEPPLVTREPLAVPDDAFGHRLQAFRKQRGMTLAQIAALLGVSKPTVWAWEQGRSRPVGNRIDPLAEALGVPQDQLYRDSSTLDHLNELIARVRAEIAHAAGTTSDKVRIMLEL